MGDSDRKLQELVEASRELITEAPKTEEKARAAWQRFFNSASDAFLDRRSFTRQAHLTNWEWNPAMQLRMFRIRYSMQERLPLGLATGLFAEVTMPGRVRGVKLFLFTYLACPEYFSIFIK
mmetsp:Transcript_27585/g.32400  ORF Transcript_27585/g.32400 Transcript_27585/m.32400 type:complete len:121 (-) Transcript_27585:44-406(-)